MDTKEQVEIMSYDVGRYLEIDGKYELMNIGVTKADESSNPIESSKHYVGNKAKSTKVTGYDNQISLENDLIKNEPVIDELYDIWYYRKVGTEAQRNLVLADLFRPVANNKNEVYARKLMYSIIISDCNETPGEGVKFTGNLKGNGDFIYGKFNLETKTFTEGEE